MIVVLALRGYPMLLRFAGPRTGEIQLDGRTSQLGG
jgi:hypothetical protein